MSSEPVHFSPLEENEYVIKILEKLETKFCTEQIPVQVEGYCKPLNCFVNVDEKVKRVGGKPHYGWAFMQSDILCEAERHAVWESPEGELVDITPREIVLSHIMFLSDNHFTYDGQLTDNIRVNTTKNKVIDDFILVCKTLEKFYTYGERIDDDKINLPSEVVRKVQEYEGLKSVMLILIKNGGGEKSKCICGGNKKYKDCHGKTILKYMSKDLKEIDTKYRN